MVAFGGKLLLAMYGSHSETSRLSAIWRLSAYFGGSAIGGSTIYIYLYIYIYIYISGRNRARAINAQRASVGRLVEVQWSILNRLENRYFSSKL